MDSTTILIAVLAGIVLLVLATVVGIALGTRLGRGRQRDTVPGYLQAQGQSIAGRLAEFSRHLDQLDSQRQSETAVLQHAVEDLRRSNDQIRDEARSVASAMRDNQSRGVWGEMQLRRVLESSGMQQHVDFVEQHSFTGGANGTSSRPDAVVHLPNGRCVVLDAKVPLDRFLEATATDDPAERARLLAEHAKGVAGHLRALAGRAYDDVVPGSVDVVVMFLPGDSFLAEAHLADPALLDLAFQHRIVLASPSTLLGFLRGIALGWREQRLADEARTVEALGRDLHQRLSVFSNHLAKTGKALGRAVECFNDAVGSLDRSVMPQARRFEELGAGSAKQLTTVDRLDEPVRECVTAGGPSVAIGAATASTADD